MILINRKTNEGEKSLMKNCKTSEEKALSINMTKFTAIDKQN